LPIGGIVDERLTQWLDEPQWMILAVKLLGVPQFKQIYGYSATSELLRMVSTLLVDAVDRLAYTHIFIAHVSEWDFILVLPQTQAKILERHLHRRLKKTFQYLVSDGENVPGAQHDEKPGYSLLRITHDMEIHDLQLLKNMLV